MMKATQRNICNVLGTNAEGLKFIKAPMHNGYRVRGFISRYRLEEIMQELHVYVNHKNDLMIITKGRLSRDNKI